MLCVFALCFYILYFECFFSFSFSNCHQCRHFVIVAFLPPCLLAFSRTLAMACLLFSNNKPDIKSRETNPQSEKSGTDPLISPAATTTPSFNKIMAPVSKSADCIAKYCRSLPRDQTIALIYAVHIQAVSSGMCVV